MPECDECQTIWTDAETQFRNILVVAGDPNNSVREKWNTVLRSFSKPSGKKWAIDLYKAMTPVATESGTQYMVYPYKDPRVNLVLRKIIRGLSAYHKVGEFVPDEHVWVGYAPETLPSSIRNEFFMFSLGDDFVKYGFTSFGDHPEMRSGWIIRFYESRDFIGIISKSGDAKQMFGPLYNP